MTDDEVGLVTVQPKVIPAAVGMSDEAVGLSPDFEREARASQKPGALALQAAKEYGKTLVGTAAQVSDLFTAIPKMLLGQVPYWAANTAALVKGESPRTAATAATLAKESFFPPEISAPWSVVAEAMGPTAQEAYSNNPVAWTMDAIGKLLEKGSTKMAKETGLPAEHFNAFAEQLMGSLGWRGSRASLARAWDKRSSAAKEAFKEERWKPEETAAEPVVPEKAAPPNAVQELVVTKKQVSALFDRVKKAGKFEEGDVQTVKDLFEKAKQQRGAIDPELLKALGVMAGTFAGGSALVALYNKYVKEQPADGTTPPADWEKRDEENPIPGPLRLPTTVADVGLAAGVFGGIKALKGRMETLPKGEIALKLTKAETGFFDEIHKSPADLAELVSEVPGIKYEAGKLVLPDKESVVKLQDYADKTSAMSKGEGLARLPPSFDKATFAKFEEGASTPEQLTALAGGAIGALIGMQDSDSPIRSGIYGALAGLALGHPAGRAAIKAVIKSPDVALGAISTRLGNMHPSLKLLERKHELNVLRQIDQLNDQVLPFAQTFGKLLKEQQAAAGRTLLNEQMDALDAIPTLATTLPGVARALGSLETQLKSLGRFKEGLSGYFPRLVGDLEGLKKALGSTYAEGIEKALIAAEAEMVRTQSRKLTDVEQSLVVNRYLFAADQASFQPGFAKARRVGEITPELQPFYEPPVESLLRYISGAVSDIQTARFFGRDIKVNKKGKSVYTDIDGSIGNLAARLMREGKITREQGVELREILKARFEGGDKGMSTALAAARNLTNTALLGNVASAATQIGDSLLTIYHHGAVPTIQALAERIIGRQRITPKQLGLINHVAEELSEMGITGRALHNTMKYSGFHAVDMFGKSLQLNASLIKNTRLASTPRGTAKLMDRYGKAFGDEMPQLLEDLRNRRVSDNVETLAFSELSDAQPISKAEMSEAYLRHPNGRILFQLKTFMLKQTDVVRRDVYQNIASGNPRRIMIGAKNLAALASIYALSAVPGDVIKDILAGRDVDPFTTPKLVENLMQTFGINRYAQERLSQGRVVETAQDLVTPPVRVFQDVAKGDPKAVGYIPILGRPVYERWLGGNERREISEKRSANASLPKGERQLLSPAAKDYLRQKRLEAKERKLRREQ